MRIPYIHRIFFLLFGLSVVLFGASCSKQPTASVIVVVPTVNTTSVIVNLTSTTAQSGGIIISAGNGTISQNGVCYSSTDKSPTTAGTKTSDTVSNPGIFFELVGLVGGVA